jgi:hypothetical protein
MSGNERRVETKLCGGCKTIELNGKLKELVGKFFGENKIFEKSGKGVLYKCFFRGGKWEFNKRSCDTRYETYVGEIKNGVPNGHGTYNVPHFRKYVGEFKDGEEHGQGTTTYLNGNKYVGEWRDGKQNGHGTFTLFDGKKYVGIWENGNLWNGTGYEKDGNIQGKWVNGEVE